MLIELRVRNLAVIENVTLRLEPGFNALTGETGAGKSLVVGALALLLGERASAESVRPGAARAVVEGVFDVSGRAAVADLLDRHGIEREHDLLILRREVAAEGRSRAWVNGAAATATLVGELGRMLVDLHGQHEHQALLQPDEQRRALDTFAGSSELADEVREAWQRARDCAARLYELQQREQESAQRADHLRVVVSEIEQAAVRAGEDEDLALEGRRLEHADELARASEGLHQQLYAADTSITSRLGELRRSLAHLAGLDPSLGRHAETLDSALYSLEETGRDIGGYAQAVQHDPRRLAEVRRRQDLLYRLRSRYGPGLEDVLATLAAARAELAALENAAGDRGELEREQVAAVARLRERSAQLTGMRRAAGQRLTGAVAALLPELGMGGRFEVVLEPLTEAAAYGAERVEFLLSANEGFAPRPLARVASGGELSRLMLALRAVVAGADSVPTLVFDEIDVGIGGRVAHQVGAALRQVARDHQVFVITHLAQIAARADHHLLVNKRENAGSTITAVEELRGEERIRELARLLGGDPESSASMRHARELLTQSP